MTFPKIVAIEPLPQHAGYMFSPAPGDVALAAAGIGALFTSPDPGFRIVALLHDGTPRRLEGAERAEVRRWILGGLALERLARRYAEKRAEELLFSIMGVPANALYPKRRS